MEPDEWRRKYFESLKQLDADERNWKLVEDLLRRMVGRLCLAARGQDSELDAQLDVLAEAMRNEAGVEVLQPLLAPLAKSIARLDRREAPPASAPDEPTAAVGSVLDSLLDQLELPVEQREELQALRTQFSEAQAPAALSQSLARLSALICDQLAGLRRAKADVEQLLQHVTSRLDDIHNCLQREVVERDEADTSNRDLNTRVLDEMQALDTRVRDAVDLSALKQQVADRLKAIGTHLNDFLHREEQRTRRHRERADAMCERVRALERKASSLQASLRHEQQMALTDALTGIPNRMAYEERIRHSHARWKRYGSNSIVVAWDIDGFKKVNDTYGHQAGDKVLRKIGQNLLHQVRAADFVARYGGEEFVMILDDTPVDEAYRLAERLREGISTLGFHFHGQRVPITISCGLTPLSGSDTPETVFERADRLLYEAKNSGRNRCIAG